LSTAPLTEWQAEFFANHVRARRSGADGVYFREQVFGALDVLDSALPELEAALGEHNFRFFVRELLAVTQPTDAMGTSLIVRFLDFLSERAELRDARDVHTLIAKAHADFSPR